MIHLSTYALSHSDRNIFKFTLQMLFIDRHTSRGIRTLSLLLLTQETQFKLV